MRSKKVLLNSIASLLVQLVSAVCGFIVPKLIISAYGSEVNALTSSISQFLSYITLAEASVGGVARAAFYKPIADNNHVAMSAIFNASEQFFRKIAYLFVAYTVALTVFYPLLVNNSFDWSFTASLIVIIALSTFMQYFFGMTNSVLLQSDQRQYISSVLQVITIILNAVMVVAFIKLKMSIQMLKLATSLIYILKPVFMAVYVNKKYSINKKEKPDNRIIEQRWDGFGHHIANFVNSNTDVAILTFVSGISSAVAFTEVSVYSVYNSIVYAFLSLTRNLSSGVEAAFGDMLAKNEIKNLNRKMNLYEYAMFTMVTYLFLLTGLLLIPFMKVYMHGVTDADYIRPVFGIILVIANAMSAIRIPYQIVVYAAGHYKQTKKGAYAEAIINIVLSLALVPFFALEGVAIGTLAAMTFRTVQYVAYLSKNIINRSIKPFLKRMAISTFIILLSVAATQLLPSFDAVTYLQWVIYAIEVALVVTTVTVAVNLLLCRKEMAELWSFARRLLRGKKRKER